MAHRLLGAALSLSLSIACISPAHGAPEFISDTQFPIGDAVALGSVPGSPLGGSSIEREGQFGQRFYDYEGDLSAFPPGHVLKTRTLPFHVSGVPTPLKAVQLLYVTTDISGAKQTNVTSIALPNNLIPHTLVSYHSIYDSLNPEHSPSRSIAGNVSVGTSIMTVETALVANLLNKGYAVAFPDIEGSQARFAVGPEYGRVTLDSLRAAMELPEIGKDARLAIMGYSGGSIATAWAAQLGPSYAPDVNKQIIAAAMGGVLVAPANNIDYIDGAPVWSGITAMTIVGVSRAFPDFRAEDYLNDYGLKLIEKVNAASIAEVEAQFGGIRWVDVAKPEYQNPLSIPAFVDAVNQLNLGLQPNPTMPFQIWQATGGHLEGTKPNERGIGDGVMLEADVRGLATKYCESVPVEYSTDPNISHTPGTVKWSTIASPWILDRLEGKPAPNNCGSFPPGTEFAPATLQPQATPVDPGPAQGSASLRVR